MSILISCMITPALATVDDAYAWAKSSFIEWLHNSYTAGHGEGDSLLQQLFKPEDGECNHVWVYNSDDYKYCERCDLGFEEYYNSKYNNYVSDLQTDLGTTTLSDGSVFYYFTPKSVTASSGGINYLDGYTLGKVSTVTLKGTYSSEPSVDVTFDPLVAPTSGYYSTYVDWQSDTMTLVPGTGDSYQLVDNVSVSSGGNMYPVRSPNMGGSSSGRFRSIKSSDFQHLSFTWYCVFTPLSESTQSLTDIDISINSRPTSITGDYGILGDDGTIIKVDKTIVDEGHSIVYNPVTNTTYNYTDYAYDYSDRSYNLTLEDGSTMKVVYGDENITIQEGDTVYNVYYLTSGSEGGSGSGGSGDDGSGGIGGAIGGLFDVLGEIIYGLIEGTINLATKALSALTGLLDLLKQFGESIISFFGGYTDFLGAVFPFLPEETFTILNLGLILMIAAAVFKKFL